MKSKLSLALIVVLSLMTCSQALPYRKRMVYYQQPMQYYAPQTPQRLMYVHYMSPPASPYARSTQSASALVAGQTVAAGTYLKDCEPAETDIPAPPAESQTAEDALNAAGVHASHAVAEAYPEENATKQPYFGVEEATTNLPAAAYTPTTVLPVEDEPVQSDHESKVPRDFNFDVTAKPAVVDLPPARVPLAPITPLVNPSRRYVPPKKKVYVELEETPETVEYDYENSIAVAQDNGSEPEEGEENDLAPPPAPIAPRRPTARKPAAKKPVKPVKSADDCVACGKAGKPSSSKPLPAGTFFPIDFGGTSGGAIAIANAFSTGEGGSATSHAIAYGSPESARGRVKMHKRH